jgi:uncharacterized protein (TIGR02466 family)
VVCKELLWRLHIVWVIVEAASDVQEFKQLERKLRRHVKACVDTLKIDLTNRKLAMTDCWVNIMPRHVAHSLHIHIMSTISGTYYVRTPKGCAGLLLLEDPKIGSVHGCTATKNGLPCRDAIMVHSASDRRQHSVV